MIYLYSSFAVATLFAVIAITSHFKYKITSFYLWGIVFSLTGSLGIVLDKINLWNLPISPEMCMQIGLLCCFVRVLRIIYKRHLQCKKKKCKELSM